MTLKTPKTAQPMRLPNTMTASVSTRLSPNVIPKAPRTQLIGAMLAPDQIQNSSHGEQSRLPSGMGSMPWASNGTAASATSPVVVGVSSGLVAMARAPHCGMCELIETPPDQPGQGLNIHDRPLRLDVVTPCLPLAPWSTTQRSNSSSWFAAQRNR